jgi:hypothetical protein
MSEIVHSSPLRQALGFAFAIALSGCASGLGSELDHRACSPDGRCLAGYVCSEDNLCVRDSDSRTISVRAKQKQSSLDAGTPDAADGVQVGAVLDGGADDARVNDLDASEHEPSAPSPMVPNPAPPVAGSGGTAAPPVSNLDTGGDVAIPVPAQGAAGNTTEPVPIAGAGGASTPLPTAGAGGRTTPSPVAGAPAMPRPPMPPPPTPATGAAAGSGAPPGPTAGAPAPECARELTLCGARCVDLKTDADNCGGCGDSCDADEQCKKSKCEEGNSGEGSRGKDVDS